MLIVPEYDAFGGTLTFFKRVIEMHREHGIETAVLVEKRQLFPEVVEFLKRHGVRIFIGPARFGRFRNPLFAPFFDLVFCLSAYRAFRPDLMVVSNGTPGMMTGALVYPRPVVFFLHTYPRHARMRWLVRFYLSRVSRLRNRLVTVSNFAAVKIGEVMGIPRGRIEVLYNSFVPVTAGLEEHRYIVLTIGHVASFKDPETWLDVAQRVVSRHPLVRFVWLGGGDLLEKMRARVDERGLGSRVEFAGYCDDVRSFFRKTAVYFQPSIVESHGISVVEAMAHGIPCVTSTAGGLPESVVDGETGVTAPPYDTEGFVAGIAGLLDDPALAARLGAAGRERAERLFSEASQERKMLDLYAALLPASRRG